jgi:DNA-binding MarR family transcriptional regulator/GNAT superfamily N-acetyltransferase
MFLSSQHELALGSRFKAVSEALYGIANEVYSATGVELDARAFPLLRYLQVRGSSSVTQIAAEIGQSHPGVSQMAAKLLREGWLTRKTDRTDARRGLLDLSAKGEERLGKLGPVWTAIRRATKAAAARSTGTLLEALSGFEAEIADGKLQREILKQHAQIMAAKIEVKPFRSQWREHFYRINAEWLRRHFVIEGIDQQVLSEPENRVIKPGGAIFFALLDGEVIGTCALLCEAPGIYELSKMGTESGFRGFGAGRLLAEAAIAEFHRRKGKRLFLESSKKLTPALTLYESVGFVHQPAPRPGSHYQRADVYMVYQGKRRSGVAAKTKARARTGPTANLAAR